MQRSIVCRAEQRIYEAHDACRIILCRVIAAALQACQAALLFLQSNARMSALIIPYNRRRIMNGVAGNGLPVKVDPAFADGLLIIKVKSLVEA